LFAEFEGSVPPLPLDEPPELLCGEVFDPPKDELPPPNEEDPELFPKDDPLELPNEELEFPNEELLEPPNELLPPPNELLLDPPNDEDPPNEDVAPAGVPTPPGEAIFEADPRPAVGSPASGCPKNPFTVVFASPTLISRQSDLPVIGSMYFCRRKRILFDFSSCSIDAG
jgi:hypothetical protein